LSEILIENRLFCQGNCQLRQKLAHILAEIRSFSQFAGGYVMKIFKKNLSGQSQDAVSDYRALKKKL
jgi:hypothetical protein